MSGPQPSQKRLSALHRRAAYMRPLPCDKNKSGLPKFSREAGFALLISVHRLARLEHHGIPHIVIIGEGELGALGQNDVVQGVLIGVVAVEPGTAIHRAGVLHWQVKGKVAAARRAGHVVDAGFDVLAHKQIQAVLAVAEGIRNIAGHRVGGSIGGQVIDLRVAAAEIERIVPGMSANPIITGNLLIHTFHCQIQPHSWKRFWDYDTFVV